MKLHRIFFFLLILFLPTQLGLHFWPAWAMVLGRRIDYLAPTVYGTDILIILTLVSWIFVSSRPTWRSPPFGGIPLRREIFQPLLSRFLDYARNDKWFLILFFVGANIFISASPSVALYHCVKVL